MQTTKLYVYDPPMCCSSGVCGPSVDPQLVTFASDLDWLRQQGVEVERYNLSAHPAEFAQQDAVKDALHNEGNACLPVLVVDGTIVSKGVYPTRSELAGFCGIDGVEALAETDAEPETACCGPGCNCGTPSGSKAVKTIVSLIVLLAVAGIVVYKTTVAKPNASDAAAVQANAGFAVTPGNIAADATVQGSEKEAASSTFSVLESMGALNTVAKDTDAVFVYIPAQSGESASTETMNAVAAAQSVLQRNNIKLGLFTLAASSPDYANLSKQAQAPAILVAVKGKGMSAVSGDVSETKLLQAFTTCSRAGGCGAGSSCGPSGPGCK